MEVYWRDGGDAVRAHALGMGGKLHAVARVVAGNVRDNRDAACGLFNDRLKHGLALGYGLIDALAGGTADVHARHLFAYQILRKRAHALGRHLARVVIAGVERRDNALIFRKVYCFHCTLLVFAPVSALDGAHRDAPREIFLEDEEHDDDRHGGKGCARHDESEVRRVFRLHLRDAQGNGQVLRA